MIGNRLRAATGTTEITDPAATLYTPNALNQYTAVGSLNPAYDADGNATAYPLPANPGANSTLVWDAENRLTSTTVNGTTTSYQYDAQSRRIAIWRAGLQPASSPPSTTFIYDSWNPIAEYGGAGLQATDLSKTYTWGIDLSGSMQGAGGVGGLLAVTDATGSYYPTYDGNGNVSEYLDETGAIAAHYEYDPFGTTTTATGPKAPDFTHRFSTKPLDAETGLYYYGYRYYDPVTGRWPSRDPIGEEGGINIYGFVGNDGVNLWDNLGLAAIRTDHTATIRASLALSDYDAAEVSYTIIKDDSNGNVDLDSFKLSKTFEDINPYNGLTSFGNGIDAGLTVVSFFGSAAIKLLGAGATVSFSSVDAEQVPYTNYKLLSTQTGDCSILGPDWTGQFQLKTWEFTTSIKWTIGATLRYKKLSYKLGIYDETWGPFKEVVKHAGNCCYKGKWGG
jgi:RHS repeat-associated protein